MEEMVGDVRRRGRAGSPRPPKWLGMGLAASVGTALAAAGCCLGPTLLILAGGMVTAAAGSVFETLAAWRPVFVALAFGFLAADYTYVYRGKKNDCADGTCAPRNPVNRALLIVATIIVVVLVTSPYWLVYLP